MLLTWAVLEVELLLPSLATVLLRPGGGGDRGGTAGLFEGS